jgi:ubiquitin carboxyl-terminal hydrolase 9/24
MIEDPLQLKRFILTIDGFKDTKVEYFGLLSIIRQNQSSDAKKSYQCVKFIVTVANKYKLYWGLFFTFPITWQHELYSSSPCKEHLLKSPNNWEWSVNWLKNKMADSSLGSSQYINWNNSKYQSNEDSDIKTFQRTKSAQVIISFFLFSIY